VLTDDDRLRAEIIERIMCDFGADLGQICARHGSAPEAMLTSSPRLRDLISDGVVELDGTSLAVRMIRAFWFAAWPRPSMRSWTGRSGSTAARSSIFSRLLC
jgi:coproporphyrinogen III oxidase-like Fe-S oxidoreductase